MNDTQGATLLAVDDAEEIRDLLQVVMENAGYKIRLAEDGVEALESVSANPPDLILLDIDMPRMDGFETCRRLKQDEGSKDIPVIFLSSETDIAGISRGFELGAVDYITKPVTEGELLARVKTHIQLKRALQRLDHLAAILSEHLPPQVYASLFESEADL